MDGLHGRRTLNRKELLKAWAILFGFLTLALAPVSLILGHSYLGFIGISGFPSLIFRAGAAAVIIGLLVCWALIRPEGAAVNPPDDAWWRLVWKRVFIVTFWIAAWLVFQFNWLQPWLKEQFGQASRVQAAVSDGPSGPVTPGIPQPASSENQAAAVNAIRAYGGFVKTNLAGRVFRISLVYDEDEAGNRRECPRTDDEFVQWLPAFPELEELWLWKSQANDRTLQVVGEMRHLKELHMWYPAVTDAGVAHLQNLTELRRLHMNNAGLGDAALAAIAKLPRLEWLSLQGNNFTDEGLVQLQGMASLRALYIAHGTDRFTAAGAEPLVRRGILRDYTGP
jgi:hypothetical protein